MNKPKIYIAGKVTGEEKLSCITKFDKAAKKVEALGFEAVNPLTVVGTWEIEWDQAMKKCIKELLECDAVFMLPDCAKSEGARLETRLASALKIPLSNNLELLKMNFENDNHL